MFYATKVKSVDFGYVVDTQGRRLSPVGDLPVKVGDTIFSDGKFFFGHAPPRGTPAIFDEPSGIPVLADFDSSGDKELRGYFSRNAIFKPYKIASDEWIVNSNRKFAHGKSFFYGEEVIDAYIADNNNLNIVTDAFFRQSHTLDTTSVAFWAKDTHTWYKAIPVHGPYVYEQILGSSALPDENIPAQFFINEEPQDVLDLSLFAKDVEARALLCAEKIMEQSFDGESSYPYVTPEEITQKEMEVFGRIWGTIASGGSINQAAKPPPEQPSIVHSTAYILSCNTNEEGFSAIAFAAAYGFCFPYIESRFFVSRINHEDIYIVNGTKAIREWKCVPFGFSCLYEIHPDKEPEVIAFRDCGGINSLVPAIDVTDGYLVSSVSGVETGLLADILQRKTLILQTDFESSEWEKLLPVGDGFFTLNKFGLLTFFDSNQNKVAKNIPVNENFCYLEFKHCEFAFANGVMRFNNVTNFWLYDLYTPDGNVEEKIFTLVEGNYAIVHRDEHGQIISTIYEYHGTKDESFPPVDGYYVKKDDDSLEPLQFTPLFYEFNDGSFLYGVKGGKLFHKTKDGNTLLVGDDVKNFRLRELKRISRAKN